MDTLVLWLFCLFEIYEIRSIIKGVANKISKNNIELAEKIDFFAQLKIKDCIFFVKNKAEGQTGSRIKMAATTRLNHLCRIFRPLFVIFRVSIIMSSIWDGHLLFDIL